MYLKGGDSMEKYYTVQEIAERLQTHKNTIRRWIKERKLGASKIGKEYRISETQLKQFIEKSK